MILVGLFPFVLVAFRLSLSQTPDHPHVIPHHSGSCQPVMMSTPAYAFTPVFAYGMGLFPYGIPNPLVESSLIIPSYTTCHNLFHLYVRTPIFACHMVSAYAACASALTNGSRICFPARLSVWSPVRPRPHPSFGSCLYAEKIYIKLQLKHSKTGQLPEF